MRPVVYILLVGGMVLCLGLQTKKEVNARTEIQTGEIIVFLNRIGLIKNMLIFSHLVFYLGGVVVE